MNKTNWRRMQFVRATGQFLYGAHWGRQLAKDIEIANITVYYYANGKAVVPLHVVRKCAELLKARKQAITALQDANEDLLQPVIALQSDNVALQSDSVDLEAAQ